MLFSILIYGFVSFVSLQSGVPSDSGQQMVFPLTLVGAVTFILAFVLPKFLGKMAQPAAELRGRPLQKYFLAFVIRLALLEAVAIYGVVLTFILKDINYFVFFATPAVVGFFLSFPTLENFKKLVGER